MKITQIRNATIVVEFAGKRFLIDPMLSSKGEWGGFPGTPNSERPNPLVDLPMSVSEILNVDAVIVTHTHMDHWDDAARRLVPKSVPVFTKDPKDAWEIMVAGFRDVRVLEDVNEFDGVTLIKTAGQHGRGEVLEGLSGELLGRVCGIVFKHESEKTLYVAGDTVWYERVEVCLKAHNPDVVVLNCGDAKLLPDHSIIMNKLDVLEVCKAAPSAVIIASHMEAVNHSTLSRTELREFVDAEVVGTHVLIPADGESYHF